MDFTGLMNLQLMMFIEIAIGWFLKKKNIITEEGKKVITDLVIDLLLPCNIICAFNIPMDSSILVRGIQVLVISLLLQLFCALISATCYNRMEPGKRAVIQYATVCSNAGFLGNPVVEGLYGSLGLLYASIYLIPQRIVMWSAGVSYFAKSPSKKEVFKKVITHPCIVAVGIGLVVMLTQVQLPTFVEKTLSSIGGCTTAMTMLLIGTIMAGADWKTLVCRTNVWFAAVRLIGIPLVVLVACVMMGVDATAAGVCTVLAAMPAGSTTAILAARYHVAEEFAGKCVVFTTILSMVAIPVWCVVIQMVYA